MWACKEAMHFPVSLLQEIKNKSEANTTIKKIILQKKIINKKEWKMWNKKSWPEEKVVSKKEPKKVKRKQKVENINP